MTEPKQPEAPAFCWATELAMTQQPVTLSVTEAREVSAEMQRMRAESEARRIALLDEMQKAERLKADIEHKDKYAEQLARELAAADAEARTMRTGYAAARLEIESLQARIKTMAEEHADELMVAHLDGRSQAAQQPAPSAAATQDMIAAVLQLVDLEQGDVEDHRYDDGSKLAEQICKAVLALVPQPSPTPQADSQPAPATAAGSGEVVAHRLMRKSLNGEWASDARDWSDGPPSRALVDSVCADKGRWRIDVAYAAPAAVAGPSGPSITLDFKMASELLDMFGGEPGLVTLQHGGEKCHSGVGLYAWYSDLPEEGAGFLGAEPDDEATPTTQPAPQREARPVTPYTCPKCHALWLHWPAEQSGFAMDTLNCRSTTHCDYCEKGGVEQLQRLERVPAALAAPQPAPQQEATEALARAEYYIDNPSAWSSFDQRMSDDISDVTNALRAALAALNDAATSLETIAHLAGRTAYGTPPIETNMETLDKIRIYASARALVASAAQECSSHGLKT